VKKPAPKVKAPEPDSDAMEESSEEESSDEEAELDMETFDTQRLVKDEEDQKYLDSLPEIEREAILAERFEKRKAELDMKKALRESKRKEREGKSALKKKDTKTKKKATAAKKPAKKTKDAVESEESDTNGDENLAKTLAGKRESARNRDATGSKAQKNKALAALREVSIVLLDGCVCKRYPNIALPSIPFITTEAKDGHSKRIQRQRVRLWGR
jgi:hypothetical protein